MAISMDDPCLIKTVRQYPFLYDKREANFKNKAARDTAWGFISDCLNVSALEAENRWAVLRHRYAKERRDMKNTATSADSNPNLWIYYHSMDFLGQFIQPRRSYVTQAPAEAHSSDSESLLSQQDNSNFEDLHIKLEDIKDIVIEEPILKRSIKVLFEENPLKRRKLENNDNVSKIITKPIEIRKVEMDDNLSKIHSAPAEKRKETNVSCSRIVTGAMENIVVSEREADEWDKYGQIFAQGLRAIPNKTTRMEVIFDITRLLTLHRPEES